MPTLTVKNTPDYIIRRLRERAQRNHRSLQGELLSIVEKAAMEQGMLSNEEFFAKVKSYGFKTGADSVEMIREDRAR